MFAKEVLKRKPNFHSLWRWHIDEIFVKLIASGFFFGERSITLLIRKVLNHFSMENIIESLFGD